MKLTLADGQVYAGRPFGAIREARGEVVFNTGMTGYVETLTDPSYRGQILVLTYPLQGNYGVPPDGAGFESDRVQVAGLVVTRHCAAPSHHLSTRSLGAWLTASGVPAVEGIDTRTLTQHLREHGTIGGTLVPEPAEITGPLPDPDIVDPRTVVSLVTPRRVERHPGEVPILVIDTGAKENIVRCLLDRGAGVLRMPYDAPWHEELGRVRGVLLTNGPGDPTDLMPLVERIREHLLPGRIPVFGICLGHQLLALAAGARTFKLKYGHRSMNQPVQDVVTKRAYVTSQNHGYAVDDASLPAGWTPWFVNLNDHTNEGIRHTSLPLSSVQFHPEAAAGPRDTAPLFDAFVEAARRGAP